jgi:hypothetical protein
VMFAMESRVPQQQAHKRIGADAASIAEAVRFLRDLAIGMFQVTEVVDHRVAEQHGEDPPKHECLTTLRSLSKVGKECDVVQDLQKSSTLKIGHYARLLAVGPFLEAPPGAAVVNSNAARRKEDAPETALEGVWNIEELSNVPPTSEGDVAKTFILENGAVIVARQLGVLVNMVGVGVMLLVHNPFMLAKLEAEDASVEQAEVIDPLGLEGVAVEEFVLTCKRKALKLESIEEVDWDEDGELSKIKAVLVKRKDTQPLYDLDSHGSDGKIGEESLEALIVGFLHESNQDSVIKKTITFLSLRVLDIGPVLACVTHVLQAISIGLLVEMFRQGGGITAEGNEDGSCVGGHFNRR